MADMERLQERLYEKLHRRPAGIDRMDRLWEAAVLLPIVRTEEGPAVLFEVPMVFGIKTTAKDNDMDVGMEVHFTPPGM